MGDNPDSVRLMRVLIGGGSGFLGTALCRWLEASGHTVTLISTRAGMPPRPGDSALAKQRARIHALGGALGAGAVAWEPSALKRAVATHDAVVNLAGAGLSGSRWTPAYKKLMEDSRVGTTRMLVEAMARVEAKDRPRCFIGGSAIGCYLPDESMEYTEDSPLSPAGEGPGSPGADTLSRIVEEWEHEAMLARTLGVRTLVARTGVVLGAGGGVLSLLSLPFKWYLGGVAGNGRQWVSWIHLEDHVRLMAFLLEHPTLSGPVNLTAPQPVRQKVLAQTLGRVLDRPCWLPQPAPLIRLAMGEAATLALEGQRVLPSKALGAGFDFNFPKLDEALENICGKTL